MKKFISSYKMESFLIHSKDKNELKLEISSKKNILEYIDEVFRVKSKYIIAPKRVDFAGDKIYIVFPFHRKLEDFTNEELTQSLLKKLPFDLLQGCKDFYYFNDKVCTLKNHIYYDNYKGHFSILPIKSVNIDAISSSVEKYAFTQIYNIFVEMNIYISPELQIQSELKLNNTFSFSDLFPKKQYKKLVFLTEENLLDIPNLFEEFQDYSCEFVFLLLELFLRCCVEKETFINSGKTFNLNTLRDMAISLLERTDHGMTRQFLEIAEIIGWDTRTSLFYRYKMTDIAAIYLDLISTLNFEKYFLVDYADNIRTDLKKRTYLETLRESKFKDFIQNIINS